MQASRGEDEENPQDQGGKKDQPQAEKKKDEAGKQEEQVRRGLLSCYGVCVRVCMVVYVCVHALMKQYCSLHTA